jgi:hypothetical protein
MRFNRGIFGVALLAALTACGGGSFGGGSSTGSSSSGATTGSSLVELGSGIGSSFKNQALDVQVTKTLSAGGSTEITANIVDANNANALYTQSVTVNFSSNCASAGTASITQSVTTTNGTAIATYTAEGCSGADTITASATVGSATLSATGIVTVASPSLGSLVFISATPNVVSVKGAGGVTNSIVIFQVNDANGHPISGVTVDFGLSTTQGGITFSPTSQVTSTNGQASTVITAGTVHTAVSVIATVPSTGLSQTAQNAVSISTGVPVQSRFSMSIVSHNVQAYTHDGVTDVVDIRVGDIFGNPVAVGTNVAFISNAGIISGTCPPGTPTTTACGSCQTDVTGHCSVVWTSEGNRPRTDGLNIDGHAHILAFIAGEEEFRDKNDDGSFDAGDTYSKCSGCDITAFQGDSFFDETTLANSNAPAFNDIGDPYMDSSETGIYLSPEPFVDIDSSVTTRRQPDGEWYGVGCGGFGSNATTVAAKNTSGGAETITCAKKLTMIGKEDCIIMSTDSAVVTDGVDSTSTPVTTVSAGAIPLTGTAIFYTVTDLKGNAIAKGSKVAIVNNAATGVTLTINPSTGGGSSTSFTEADEGCQAPHSSPNMVQTFEIIASAVPSATQFSGSFQLQYTSADGSVSVASAPIFVVP